MTLAFHGKSPRRQAGLVLAALLTIGCAAVAGVSYFGSAGAATATRPIRMQVLSTSDPHPTTTFDVVVGSAHFAPQLQKLESISPSTDPQELPANVSLAVSAASLPLGWTQPDSGAFAFKRDGSGAACTGSETYSPSITIPADTLKYLVCVKNTYSIPQPSISKSQTSGPDGLLFYWNISVINIAPYQRIVRIADSLASFVDQVSLATTGSCPGLNVDCIVSPNKTLTVRVSRPKPAPACSDQAISNTASFAFAATPGTVIGSSTALDYIIPASTSSECQPASNPTVVKTAADIDGNAAGVQSTDTAKAYWDINIVNTLANSVARSGIVITDTGATLESASPASCSPASGTGPWTCSVAAGGTTTLRVSKPLSGGTFPNGTCQPGSIDNSLTSAKLSDNTVLSLTQPAAPISVPGTAGLGCLSVKKEKLTDTSYEITVHNTGPTTTATIVDTFANGTTSQAIASAPSGCVLSNANRTLTCASYAIGANADTIITVTMTAYSNTQLCPDETVTNTVAATFSGQTIPVTVGGSLSAPNAFHTARTDCDNGNIVIKKVKDPAATVPAADGSQFSGTISPASTWGPIGFGGATAPISVAPGTHTVAETGTQNGWTPVGWALGTSEGCPALKTAYTGGDNSQVSVTTHATTYVCVMNTHAPITRKLTVIKTVDNVAHDTTTFPVFLDGNSQTAAGNVSETQSLEVSIDTNSHTLEEGVTTGYSYVDGFVLAPGSVCEAARFELSVEGLRQLMQSIVTLSAPPVTIPAGSGDITVCLVNHRGTGNIIVAKVNRGGAQGDVFTAAIDGGDSHNFSATTPTGEIPVDAGNHTVSEGSAAGYSALGWREGAWDGGQATCPDTTPFHADTSYPIETSQIAVSDGATRVVCFYNEPAKGHLTLTKTVDNTNGGNATTADFTPSIDNSEVTWGTPMDVTPGSHDIDETGLPGYAAGSWSCDPAEALTGSSQVNIPPGGNVSCTVTNRSEKAHIIVRKVYVLNGATKEAPAVTVNGSQVAGPNGAGDAAHDNWNQVDVTAGSITVAEDLPTGWTTIGVAFSGNCGKQAAANLQAGTLGLQVADPANTTVDVGPGQTCTVTFTNERELGTLHIIKKTQGVADPHNATFSGAVDNSQAWGPLSDGGMSAAITVVTGDHSVQENAASQDPALWTPLGMAYATGENHTCPVNPDAALTRPHVGAGEDVYVCIYNLRKDPDQLTGTVRVIKVVTGNNPDTNQSFTVQAGGQSGSIKHNGSATFNFAFSTDKPTVDVTNIGEPSVPANYTRLGYKVINGGVLSCDSDPATLATVVASVPTLTVSAEHPAYTVCVYNQGAGAITVSKTTTLNGAPNPAERGHWQITVTSAACSVNQTKLTDINGGASFPNLPTCNDYVVSENINSLGMSSGYAPVGVSSYSGVAVTAGGNTTRAFTNNRDFTPPLCLFGCSPLIITTPTATPTTPTSTPTPTLTTKPTEPTKTEKPEVPNQTPTTNVDIVGGEKTPGPGANATPLAPSTGSGLFGTGKSSSNLLLAVIGVFALSAGFAVVAVARRQESGFGR